MSIGTLSGSIAIIAGLNGGTCASISRPPCVTPTSWLDCSTRTPSKFADTNQRKALFDRLREHHRVTDPGDSTRRTWHADRTARLSAVASSGIPPIGSRVGDASRTRRAPYWPEGNTHNLLPTGNERWT